MRRILRGLQSLVLKLAAAAVFVAEAVGHWFSTGGDDLLLGGSRWLLSHLADNPEAQRALVQTYATVSRGVQPYRALSLGLITASVAVLLAAVLVPPLLARVWRPRVRVFVSFHRSRERDAQTLQLAMEAAGITVLRMPYSADATHQEVVGTPIEGIRACHLFVGLPGPRASFVDHEVYAATALEKPMAFVVSERAGRLPDSADKRYPVFRLEALRAQGHAQMVQFLRHVASDFRSTVLVVRDALRHPAVSVPMVWLVMVGVLAVLGLFGFSLAQVWAGGHEVLTRLPASQAPQARLAVVAGGLMLFLLSMLALAAASYAVLVLMRLAAQFRARRRMQRASAAAACRREDWAGLLPGRNPGEPRYEALFDTAPAAHHEVAAQARVTAAARPASPPAAAPRRGRGAGTGHGG